MAVFYYDSTHAGAPQLLNATAGNMLTILDACLVGVSGTAYGSTASMGWTQAYSGTNQRSYRMPTATTQFYLHAVDTATGATAPVYFRGYETMTALGAGSNPFPTVAQMTNGVVFDKGNSATTNNRRWALWSNGKIFHFFVDYSNEWYNNPWAVINSGKLFSFGDINSYNPADQYPCGIWGYTAAGSVTWPFASSPSATSSATYMARAYDGTTLSVISNRHAPSGTNQFVELDNDIYNGSILVSPFTSTDYMTPNRIPRGTIPGLYCRNTPHINDIATLEPLLAKSGDYYTSINLYNSGYIAIKTSGTW